MNSPETVPGAARVLVVDDEPDLRTLYELTLLREGHHVFVSFRRAHSGHLTFNLEDTQFP